MVKALHRAGIEVILDVVYNHTAEGNENGPTLCFRGLDNAAYYRLDPGDPSRYYDTTGTGNSLNAGDPRTLRMIMDSLRYWLTEMHVDGFRFDLAATLGRDEETGSFDQMSAFFEIVAQDPVVSTAKLIAEPWDVGQADSYDLGRFPAQLAGVERALPRLDARLLARSRRRRGRVRDPVQRVVRPVRRRPPASDRLGQPDHRARRLHRARPGLLRRQAQPGQRRGEPRRHRRQPVLELRRGRPDDDPEVNALRARQSRAMLSTLLLSFGLPLLLGGDEIGRTQGGNNNAYCQDNEISWVDWEAADDELRSYVQRLLALRRGAPGLPPPAVSDRRRGGRTGLVQLARAGS